MELSQIAIKHINGVGKVKEAAYNRLGVYSMLDLLNFYPRAYENRGEISLLSETAPEFKSAVILTVSSQPKISRISMGKDLLKFKAFDDSGVCEITYFNQNYLVDKFPIGSTFRFWGKVEKNHSKYTMISPTAEAYSEGFPLPPVVAVYKLTEGLTQKQISHDVQIALNMAATYLDDYLPEAVRAKFGLSTLLFALRNIHTPDSYTSLAIARRRLMFDELFLFAAGMSMSSHNIEKPTTDPCPLGDVSPLLELLPYTLTNAQSRTIKDISTDMSKFTSMCRIVVGDVGCGKTICAAAALYIAVKNNKQAALMAPTEILATQHYNDLSELFSKLGIRCELLVGSLSASKKKKIKENLVSGDIDVLIGTHALISDGVVFKAPGLIVTDEQHRFGVKQRAALSDKNQHSHMLVMSATPIPRSMALVLYGDLKMSKIDEMPIGRQIVDTFLVDDSYRSRLDAFIRKNVSSGGQVYIVCPAVEETDSSNDELTMEDIVFQDCSLSEDGVLTPGITHIKNQDKAPLKAAVKYCADLSERMPEFNICFVHGKMKGKDKDNVMSEFAAGKIDILVSTTVIEVGVNVPNACLMIVENAERFGLSQLHQLRGRVGRGSRKSYCVLVSGSPLSKLGASSKKRLDTICKLHDGFKIAEVDLDLRGPGDFLARSGSDRIQQSGGYNFNLASNCEDKDFMNEAFSAARHLTEENQNLSEYPLLKKEIDRLFTINSDIIS